LVRDDLARVEAELARHADSAIEPVAAIARHLQASGGKRLRPALHLLAAKFCGYEGRSSVQLGSAPSSSSSTLPHSCTMTSLTPPTLVAASPRPIAAGATP
jgi:octaprenyl-diphosphate synthase